LFVATQRGAVKKMNIAREFDKTSRAKRGVVMLRELKTHPHRVAGIEIIDGNTRVWLRTEKDIIESVDTTDLRNRDRYNNGSFVFDTDETGEVIETWSKRIDDRVEDQLRLKL
jgi:topoisomerase-4 subunit A